MAKVNILYLSRELLDGVHFPACPLGTLAVHKMFPLTADNYSHSTSTALNVQYALWKRFLQKYHTCDVATTKHQNGTWKGCKCYSHIKVTRPFCLFQLPSWENVKNNSDLQYVSDINHWFQLSNFTNSKLPALNTKWGTNLSEIPQAQMKCKCSMAAIRPVCDSWCNIRMCAWNCAVCIHA